MKKLEDKVSRLEGKAKRKLLQKQSREMERQARKFREDSMKIGASLSVAGERIYDDHPVYVELIEPLLREAARIATKYGFNCLYQTHTPIPGHERYTSAIGAFDEETMTPTMKGCVELIKQRPQIKGKLPDFKKAEKATDASPETKSDNAEQ